MPFPFLPNAKPRNLKFRIANTLTVRLFSRLTVSFSLFSRYFVLLSKSLSDARLLFARSTMSSAYLMHQFVKEPHHQAAQQPSAASKIQKYFPKACKQRRFHAQFASFFRFMAANLSLTHCVTRVRPLMWV